MMFSVMLVGWVPRHFGRGEFAMWRGTCSRNFNFATAAATSQLATTIM